MRTVMSPGRGNTPGKACVVLACVLLAAFLCPQVGQAQYFGKNKVRYESFDFKRLRTEHFDVYYYPVEQGAVHDAGIRLERWNYRLSEIFDRNLSGYQPVIIYANQADFQQTNVTLGIIGQGTGGFTEGMKNRVVLPLTGVYSQDDHVLGHELVHAFQYEIASSPGETGYLSQAPLWFIEGMAEYLSLGREDPLTAMWLRDAVLNNDIPSIREVSTNPRYFPYRYGHAIWAYLTGRWGDGIVKDLFKATVSEGWEKACSKVLGTSADTLSLEWRDAVKKTYGPAVEGLTAPADVGRPVVTGDMDMNMAPVVSSDGRYLALLSRHDVFTIDLYLADARTGEVLEKLVSSSSDAHFDALRFIESAGTWSPDGKQFAFVVFDKGNNKIAILDVEDRQIVRKITVADADAMRSLAWSPDGRYIAIGGTHGGISDLYLYDLQNSEATRITDGPYAELQPAWSPDGATLAFATDRGGGTNLEIFRYGPMRICLMNLKTGDTYFIAVPGATKNINPQFSPDGKALYLIADPGGVSDIYKYSFGEEAFYRITSIATGITGLTDLSPAMSMAAETGDMVFSVFEHGGYNVYGLKDTLQAPPVSLSAEPAGSTPGGLVGTQLTGTVEEYLSSPRAGLPRDTDFVSTDYHPSLELLDVEAISAGVFVDRSGTYLGGGVSFLFGDLLGNHLMGASVAAGGTLKDVGGEVAYQNLKHRLDWGGSVGHIPYITAEVRTGIDTVEVDGTETPASFIELIRQRMYVDRLLGFTEYPLSTNRRVEMTAGFTRLSYDQEVDRNTFTPSGLIEEERRSLPAPTPLNLLQVSLAYVGDYSFFGIASPAENSRYRFEVEQSLGSLTYLTLLADYRHYFFVRPVTFAVRGLHLARYLKDAEDERLSLFYLGSENLVRGYSLGSFTLAECSGPDSSGRCPELDRLLGSRLAVFNAEVRVPLFGPEGYGLIHFTQLPTELAVFFDAGTAWTKEESPVFEIHTKSQKRIPVFSTGVAARFRVLNSIVLQVFYVYPFQRPVKGGHFRFIIGTGW
jgi:WD40 repeat protein